MTDNTKTLFFSHASESFSDEFLVSEQLCQANPIDNGGLGYRIQCGLTFSATCISGVVARYGV
jgi:hypothetical protein